MGGIVGIAVALIGVGWIIQTTRIGAPPFFLMFGVLFVVIALVAAIFNFKNAVGKNRYSSFDITDSEAEPDPLNQRFGDSESRFSDEINNRMTTESGKEKFCPYCGAKMGADYEFCDKCGKRLPD